MQTPRLPPAARRLIVTRPAAQLQDWVAGLRAAGVDAVGLPLIAIAPPADAAPVHAAWQQLDAAAFAAVMFVSANAVQQFFALRPAGSQWPADTFACATGPGTVAALTEQGVAPGQLQAPAPYAPSFDSEALWARIAHQPWAGRRVLVVRGETGRHWLAERWAEAGAQVQFLVAYRREAPAWGAAERAVLAAALAQPAQHAWLFSSSEAVGHLMSLLSAPEREALRGALALATHPRISQAAVAAGFAAGPVLRPEVAAVAAVAAAVEWAASWPGGPSPPGGPGAAR